MLHAGAAWDDFHRVQELAQDGWLGFENDPPTPLAFAARLWDTIGPMLLVAAVGVVVAVRRRERGDLILLSFGVAYALSLLPSHAHFDRYVLPLVPVLAVLAGRAPGSRGARARRRGRPALVVGCGRAVARRAAIRGSTPRPGSTGTIPRDALVAADTSTLPLPGRPVVRLRLPGPGRQFDPRRSLAVLRSGGVRWLVVGESVADRVLAAPADYPREARFYQALERLRPAYATAPAPVAALAPG